MASDFTKYTNYVSGFGVTGVVFGADSPILEVELNEMQEIQREARGKIIDLHKEYRNVVKLDVRYCLLEKTDSYATYKITIKQGSTFSYRNNLIVLHKDYVEEVTVERNTVKFGLLFVSQDITNPSTAYHLNGDSEEETTIENWDIDKRYNEITSKRNHISYYIGFYSSYSAEALNVLFVSFEDGVRGPKYNFNKSEIYCIDVLKSFNILPLDFKNSGEYEDAFDEAYTGYYIPNIRELNKLFGKDLLHISLSTYNKKFFAENVTNNMKCYINGMKVPLYGQEINGTPTPPMPNGIYAVLKPVYLNPPVLLPYRDDVPLVLKIQKKDGSCVEYDPDKDTVILEYHHRNDNITIIEEYEE